MRFLFCVFLLAWACNRDGGSQSATQSATTTPEFVETPTAPVDPTVDEKTTMISQFMKLVNDHRISLGLLPLIHVEDLGLISEGHSEDMASGSVAFGHAGFSDRCSEGRTIIGGGNWCGENVATGQKTVQAAYTAWMNSSGHRANIENAKGTHTGFGFAKNLTGTYYWTQIFLQSN